MQRGSPREADFWLSVLGRCLCAAVAGRQAREGCGEGEGAARNWLLLHLESLTLMPTSLLRTNGQRFARFAKTPPRSRSRPTGTLSEAALLVSLQQQLAESGAVPAD